MSAEAPRLEHFQKHARKESGWTTPPGLKPTCQDTAPSTAVDIRLKSTRRSEMRQKWRMPLEAMTWSRLRPPERCGRHAFWHSLSLVWKPHTVMSRTTWHTDQKRPKRQKPGMTRYHSSRSPSWRREDKSTVIKLHLWRWNKVESPLPPASFPANCVFVSSWAVPVLIESRSRVSKELLKRVTFFFPSRERIRFWENGKQILFARFASFKCSAWNQDRNLSWFPHKIQVQVTQFQIRYNYRKDIFSFSVLWVTSKFLRKKSHINVVKSSLLRFINALS